METEKEIPISDQIRDRFKADAPGAPECEEYAEALVAGMLADSVRGDVDPTEMLEEILAGLVKGANAAGAPLWLASRGAMLGALRSSGASGLDHEQVLDLLPASLVRLAEDGGGDFGAAAKGAVEGAIDGEDLTGIEPAVAGSRAARAAYRAAGELRESAAIRLRHILTPAVRGIVIDLDA